MDDKTFQVLGMARDLYALSNGVFDPTIAPYLQAPDFCRGASERRPDGVSFTDVESLQGNRVQFRHAGIRLDLCGIAKGFAVDEAITALRTAGL